MPHQHLNLLTNYVFRGCAPNTAAVVKAVAHNCSAGFEIIAKQLESKSCSKFKKLLNQFHAHLQTGISQQNTEEN